MQSPAHQAGLCQGWQQKPLSTGVRPAPCPALSLRHFARAARSAAQGLQPWLLLWRLVLMLSFKGLNGMCHCVCGQSEIASALHDSWVLTAPGEPGSLPSLGRFKPIPLTSSWSAQPPMSISATSISATPVHLCHIQYPWDVAGATLGSTKTHLLACCCT